MKNKIAKLAFILLVNFLFNVEYAKGQLNESAHKNTAYVSYGNIIFSSQVSMSYERLIFVRNQMETRVKANFGKYLSNNADYDTNARVTENFISLSAVQLVGLLELNGGVVYTQFKLARGFEPEPDVDYSKLEQRIAIYGNIGLRYTKNKFLIRGGIGNFELLYVGVGMNF